MKWFKRLRSSWNDYRYHRAASVLAGRHLNSSSVEGMCNASWVTNCFSIETKEQSDWFEYAVGSKVEIGVFVVHGELVQKVVELIEAETKESTTTDA